MNQSTKAAYEVYPQIVEKEPPNAERLRNLQASPLEVENMI
jgi:hypothetical protein